MTAHDHNLTPGMIRRRTEQVYAPLQRDRGVFDTADRQEAEAAARTPA
ncbi:hypothetical protein [Sphingomonas echinoides]|nr:hypothetical protein [Sphingomonas echinoides]